MTTDSLSPEQYVKKYGKDAGIANSKTAKRYAERGWIEGAKLDGRWRLVDKPPVRTAKSAAKPTPSTTPTTATATGKDPALVAAELERDIEIAKLAAAEARNKRLILDGQIKRPEEIAKKEAELEALDARLTEQRDGLQEWQDRLTKRETSVGESDGRYQRWKLGQEKRLKAAMWLRDWIAPALKGDDLEDFNRYMADLEAEPETLAPAPKRTAKPKRQAKPKPATATPDIDSKLFSTAVEQ